MAGRALESAVWIVASKGRSCRDEAKCLRRRRYLLSFANLRHKLSDFSVDLYHKETKKNETFDGEDDERNEKRKKARKTEENI